VNWLAVAAGGALGATARHLLNGAPQGRWSSFPAGIFAINALGCLTIGVLAGLLASGRFQMGEFGRLFLVVGVLGGFTTFSAYGIDTLTLARGGHGGLALLNAIGQPIFGIAAVWIGFSLGSWRP
jgi:fluoride exporter